MAGNAVGDVVQAELCACGVRELLQVLPYCGKGQPKLLHHIW